MTDTPPVSTNDGDPTVTIRIACASLMKLLAKHTCGDRDAFLVVSSLLSFLNLEHELIRNCHLDPKEWDWLFLSGMLWFSVALFYGSGLRAAHATSLRALKERRIIKSEINVDSCLNELDKWANYAGWIGLILLPLVFASGLYIFDSSFTSYTWQWAFTGLITGCPTGRTIGLLWGNVSWEIAHVIENEIVIVPGHIDGAGGLKPLGDLVLARGRVAFVALIHIGTSVVSFQVWQLHNYQHWTLVYACLFVVVIALMVVPCCLTALMAHDLLKAKKSDGVSRLNRRIGKLSRLRMKLNSPRQSSNDRKTLEEEIASLTKKCQDMQELPVWPSDAETLRRVTNLLIAVASPLWLGILKISGVLEAISAAFGTR